MRTIKLKSLSLVNFKGIRSLNIGFSDAETLVAGENGTGKTTVFDSFLWLLFGKDSTGRSDSNFNIKTLDSDGKPILHLEHSVTGVLSVDGKTVTLQRCYVENWVKPRGTTEESLKNHATEFYLNGVKLATKKEYDSEVAAIIPEDVFRMITNPFYFTSMKPEAQKEILLDMVGTLTDQDVAQTKPEYLELLAQLSGRSIAQYAKEVAAKKKACKDELSVIPSQIETARKLMPEEEDWVAIDSEIEDKNARIQQIEEQIADKSKLNEQEYQRKAFIQKQIGEKRLQLNSRMNEIATEANKGRNEASLKLNELEYSLRTEKASLDRKRQSVADMDIEIENLNFMLPPNGIVGVIGPNGAGKTTLFRLIMGLETVDKGTFEVGETVKLAYVDQQHKDIDPAKSVYQVISGGNELIRLGNRDINARAYLSRFNFSGADQEKLCGMLSGGERNRLHLAMALKEEGNVLLLDEPTNDIDVNTLRALEEGLDDFAGCAVVISHDRWFLDRICTHILAFEGNSEVFFFEGSYSEYEENKMKRLGNEEPKRVRYRKLMED